MRKRIFRGALVLALAASLLTGLLATVVYHRQSGQQLEDQLWQELVCSPPSWSAPGTKRLRPTNASPVTATWVSADGTVRYDNQSNPAEMENHLDREEIAQARE